MKRFVMMLSFILAWAVNAPEAFAKAESNPFNRLVVIVDGSGSYAGRQPSAIEKVQILLEKMAETKLRRWEGTGDEISIISLDAIPEVIWRGNLRQLQEEEAPRWTERFKARQDYARCTDLIAAFRLVAREFERAPEPAGRYLIAFTDLQDEPPTSSPSTCKPAGPAGPPAGFPWDGLRAASVAVFWVPIAQKLAWARAIAGQGGDLQIALYSESESGSVEIIAPPKARRVMTEKEQSSKREQLASLARLLGGSVLRVGLYGVGLLLALGGVSAVGGWFVRRRSKWGRKKT